MRLWVRLEKQFQSSMNIVSANPQDEYKLLLNLWCTRHTRSISTAVLFSLGLPWWLRWPRICQQTGDPVLIPESDRLPEGNDNPLQNSCLEKSMDKGVWQATVHGVVNSWTQLNDFHLKTFKVFFALQTMQIVISNWPENYINCKWQWLCSDLDKTSEIITLGFIPSRLEKKLKSKLWEILGNTISYL